MRQKGLWVIVEKSALTELLFSPPRTSQQHSGGLHHFHNVTTCEMRQVYLPMEIDPLDLREIISWNIIHWIQKCSIKTSGNKKGGENELSMAELTETWNVATDTEMGLYFKGPPQQITRTTTFTLILKAFLPQPWSVVFRCCLLFFFLFQRCLKGNIAKRERKPHGKP